MTRQPPQPLAQSFVVCREIIQDVHTGTAMLVGPFHRLGLPAFPSAIRVAVFIQMTGGHGNYRLGMQLQDAEGRTLGEIEGPEPVLMDDPVSYYQAFWRDIGLPFPQPGKYDLVLMGNGEELSRHALNLVLMLGK
jgi:hypothetical protein